MSYTPEQAASMDKILDQLPSATHAVIRWAAFSEIAFQQDNAALLAADPEADMTKLQKPNESCLGDADPRDNEPKAAASGAGKMLVCRRAGSPIDFSTRQLGSDARRFFELATAYRVPGMRIHAINDTAWLRCVRIAGQANKPCAPELAETKILYDTVQATLNEKGYAAFETGLGLPARDDLMPDARFENALAVQLGFWVLAAAQAKRDALAKHFAEHGHAQAVTEPVLIFKDLLNKGTSYAFDGKAYRAIPHRAAFADGASYEAALASLLTAFPATTHKELRRAAAIQNAYENEIKDLLATGLSEEDLRTLALVGRANCSDSRTTEALEAAVGIAHTTGVRNPGAILTGPDGKLTPAARETIERCLGNVFKIEQHSSCGAMNAIFTCWQKEAQEKGSGFAYIEGHYGPDFVQMCQDGQKLYESTTKAIAEQGFAAYEKYGIPLLGDDANKIKTCMAIQQGLNDDAQYKVEAAQEAKKGRAWAEPVLLFQHVNEAGRMYVFLPGVGTFKALPAMAPTQANKVAQTAVPHKRPPARVACCSCCRHGS